MNSFSFSSTKGSAALLLDLLPILVLAICFIQSGVDKLVDRAGNTAYFKSQFGKSPLSRWSEPLLLVLMVLELAAGALCALGFLQILLGDRRTLAFWGAALSAVVFVALFFGQRMAKDYAGAANLIPYFLLAMFAMTMTQ